MAARRETELYEPVKRMLEQQGYAVKGEVNGCDLVAWRKDEAEPVIVELKTAFNLQLLYQLIDRSAMSPHVYAAVEYDPAKHPGGGTWNDAARLCRKLGFGLIGVRFYKRKPPEAYVLCRPGETVRETKARRKAERLKREFDARSGDFNTGGTTGKPLVTAYRERALRAAAILEREGPLPPRELKNRLHDARIGPLLRDNVYGWFSRVEHGVYGLSDTGREALAAWAGLLPKLRLPEPDR
jgi:hypothetical protein